MKQSEFGSWEEEQNWARRAMDDFQSRWRWVREGDKQPLDCLLTPTNLRVLRILWSSSSPVYWPTTIARQAGLSRSAVHRALTALTDWLVVEKFYAYDGRPGSFCYRLVRNDPIAAALDKLFMLEARIYLESVAPREQATAPRPEGPNPHGS